MKEGVLSKEQAALLHAIAAVPFLQKNFYLTGGTALAACYLGHRYSEDLDFFTEHEIDFLNLDSALKSVQEKAGVQTLDFQQSFNRNLFFLHFGDAVVKTEFTYFPFPRIAKGIEEGMTVDSMLDIAVNKLFTIYQRTQARDYIDLYLLCRTQGFVIADLTAKAKAKFDWHIDPLQLGTQFLKATEAKDYPRMIEEVPLAAWQEFFTEEARKLRSEIIE